MNHRIVVAVLAVSSTLLPVAAHAQGRFGFAPRVGVSAPRFGGGFARPAFVPPIVRPAYAAPVYSQPVYAQPYVAPAYPQPVYAEPEYAEPVYSAPAVYPQPVYGRAPVYVHPGFRPAYTHGGWHDGGFAFGHGGGRGRR